MSRKVLPLHPGELLKEEIAERRLSIHALARALRVPATRIHAIVNGQPGITADTSARLGRYFGASPDFWLKMRVSYEIRCLDSQKIEREVLPQTS
jgi:addiction module HigA family antidote